MRKVLIASVMLAVIAGPAVADNHSKCEISCNPQYVTADAELNRVWKSLSESGRRTLRPAQREWIKYRDNTCGKRDDCLVKTTQQRTRYLNGVKLCLDRMGGDSCYQEK